MTATENKSTVKFISLEPDEELHKTIQQHKDAVFKLAGDQLYLKDPPHLTVYLASFPNGVDLIEPLRPLFATALAPAITITGWHVFAGDQLTGMNTLVCEIDEAGKNQLRDWQARIIPALAPLRDVAATEARFGNRWNCLSPIEQANVRTHGFPFTGPIWQPHLTIASIRLRDWERVYEALRNTPPHGVFRLQSLQEYELLGKHPQPRGTLPLQ